MDITRNPKKYSVEEVLEQVDFSKESKFKRIKKDFDGDSMKMYSDRLKVFSKKGIRCVTCGIEGIVFYKEKKKEDKNFHFNLYGFNKIGEEVLMTKDHIIPKSKGGKNFIDNYQPMCVDCNSRKNNKVEV